MHNTLEERPGGIDYRECHIYDGVYRLATPTRTRIVPLPKEESMTFDEILAQVTALLQGEGCVLYQVGGGSYALSALSVRQSTGDEILHRMRGQAGAALPPMWCGDPADI
jgi:hypothetical protein